MPSNKNVSTPATIRRMSVRISLLRLPAFGVKIRRQNNSPTNMRTEKQTPKTSNPQIRYIAWANAIS
jgi:hypothetical protein